MPPSATPAAELSQLSKADGSATFSCHGYTVTSAVNGPVEAQRRDENAFEALVDVNVRPAAGVGGTAERQLENILQAALRQLIPIRNFPRCMIQITLQVVETPENTYENAKILNPQLNLSIIPALLHSAILGLLTAAIPLKTIATATTLAVAFGDEAEITIGPTAIEATRAKSLHVLGFTSDEELLFAESEGHFSVDEYAKVLEAGERICCKSQEDGGDVAMGDSVLESANIKDFIRSVMATKVAQDLHWK